MGFRPSVCRRRATWVLGPLRANAVLSVRARRAVPSLSSPLTFPVALYDEEDKGQQQQRQQDPREKG